MKTEVLVLTGPAEVAGEGARRVTASVASLLARRNRFNLVLAGGTTPHALHRLLALQAGAGGIDWPRVAIFFGDERCVPPDHEASNFRQARETLLDDLPKAPAAIHRIRGELPSEEAASDYAGTLAEVFGNELHRFDLVILGMGTDGHTASLFPGADALHERKQSVVATRAPVTPAMRVTLTLPVMRNAREVLFLVTGKSKAMAVDKVLGRCADGELPAALVRPVDGSLCWLLDQEAARLMQKETL